MKRIYNIIYIVALACLMVVACGKEETLIPNNRIETHEVVVGSNCTATCSSTVEIGENYLTDRGVCWSTNPEPTIDDNHVSHGKKVGTLTSELNNLTGNTTYYVRAYATNQIGTHYGNELTFSTPEITLPVLTTQNVTSMTAANSAVCGGNITSDGWSKITARGVCWSTSPNPTIDDNKTEDGSGIGSFTSNITGLIENTTYYVRAYATNEKGTAYGEEKSFTTASLINGHDWVDLGLPSGLKWATCNVGAIAPEGYGYYYAWGETAPKTSYEQSNYLIYGKVMSDFSGDATYDAARANWGGTWRMPTKAEIGELNNNCTWTWTRQNGVKGYKVTGPNGNSIFLPAAGYYSGASLNGVEYGYYWSSTPYESSPYPAYYLTFSGIANGRSVESSYRYRGHTIRPVSE